MKLLALRRSTSGLDELGELALSSGRESAQPRQAAPLARTAAGIAAVAAVCGLVGLTLPHSASFNAAALLIVQLTIALFAFAFIVFAERLPVWAVRIAPALGIVQISFSVYFSGDPGYSYAAFYLWPCLYAFSFLSRRDSVLTVAWLAICYAITLILLDRKIPGLTSRILHGDLTQQFFITIASLSIAGILLMALRARGAALWRRLEQAARTDLLTGTLSELALSELLASEIGPERTGARRVTLLSVHLDGIGAINRRRGHGFGDQLLTEIAGILAELGREVDFTGRIGGTKFAMILPEIDEHDGHLVAERILGRIRHRYGETLPELRVAVGVASYPAHGESSEALFHAATTAADIGERLGSNRIVVYDSELSSLLSGDRGLELREGRAHLSAALSLSEVIDMRDPRNAAHSIAVAHHCERIGRELGLDEKRLGRLRLAGLLHDLGKLGVPDSALTAREPHSEIEAQAIRRHPQMAARILSAREFTDVREWILDHHEYLDGSGYPRGLSGAEIPLEGRILAVAEAFEETLCNGVTASGQEGDQPSSAAALERLRSEADTHYDREVIAALERTLE